MAEAFVFIIFTIVSILYVIVGISTGEDSRTWLFRYSCILTMFAIWAYLQEIRNILAAIGGN